MCSRLQRELPQSGPYFIGGETRQEHRLPDSTRHQSSLQLGPVHVAKS